MIEKTKLALNVVLMTIQGPLLVVS